VRFGEEVAEPVTGAGHEVLCRSAGRALGASIGEVLGLGVPGY